MKSLRQRYVIEGHLKSQTDASFSQAHLAVRAYINGKQVAQAVVDKRNHYKLSFESDQPVATAELRLQPEDFPSNGHGRQALAISKKLNPSRYEIGRDQPEMRVHYDWLIPQDYLTLITQMTKSYQMHGAVYATIFDGSPPAPISIDPLAGVKLEFYEVDTPPIYPIGVEPPLTQEFLGYTYSGPDGSYDFDFQFSYQQNPWAWNWLFTDQTPDIRVRIFQFVDGLWQAIYEGPVDWNIMESFHRDYFIPVENLHPIPDAGVKPEEGFRFSSLGLIPIDDLRFVDGYVTSQTGDPIMLQHQPLCGTLRIFGLFAETPPVASYQVQLARVDAVGVPGAWKNVTDPLYNRQWNALLYQWDNLVLGPDPVTGRYQNIDTQPEANWHEHALKVTWNSANEPDGLYALRLIAYDAANVELGTFQMPFIWVDNSRPEVKLEVVGTTLGQVTPCGALTLSAAQRHIQFRITAYDPAGHMAHYTLSGTRGKTASNAGAALSGNHGSGLWQGVNGQLVDFAVTPLPADLQGCPAVAYNFELAVQGLATDGYAASPTSQYLRLDTNLVVAE